MIYLLSIALIDRIPILINIDAAVRSRLHMLPFWLVVQDGTSSLK
ncbi:MAG: hypothetical protein QNJ53_26280 [Pleurocapsa sp. MO_192.B19]|nr:hypothetical protein [Pleurocapsa sp. MO_192.B19]